MNNGSDDESTVHSDKSTENYQRQIALKRFSVLQISVLVFHP